MLSGLRKCTSSSGRTRFSSVSAHIRSRNRLHIATVRRSMSSNSSLSNTAFVAAIDQGTSSTRVILYNSTGENLVSHQVPLKLITPTPGWVEQDPEEIIETVRSCLREVARKAKEQGHSVSAQSIKAVGLTNQRETTVVWDKHTGKALYNTVVWSDARTHKLVSELNHRYETSGGVDRFRKETGLPISTYFSAIKLKWLINNVAEVKTAVEERRAMFGTVDTWVLWNLTGGANGGVHVTDVTNASRTLLLNLKTLKWDEDIAKELEIPLHLLPSVKSSAEIYGKLTLEDTPEFHGVPISGCLGDQQAALVGQKCLSKGLAKSTYGTGCFVLYNTGTDIIQSQHGLLTTVGYQLGPNSPATYALEGSISTAGSGLDWLKSTLELEASTKEVCAMAETVPNSGGVCFVPSFNGILAPRWRPDARAVIIGLSFATKMPHIIRALVESIAFQGTDVLKAMALDAGAPMPRVKVDGGLSKADLLLQIQADSLGATVDRPADIESTARGAAFAAGVAVGLFPEDSTGHPMLDQPITSFTPKIDETIRSRNQRRWDKAVERSLDWAQEGEYEDEIGQQ